MTAVPIIIADAVTAEINRLVREDTYSLEFNARRSYADWDDKFEDLDSMAVDVVFVTHSRDSGIEMSAHGFLNYTVPIDVAIRKRFSPSDRDPATGRLLNASVDPLVTLLQEIHESFVSNRLIDVLPDAPEASWTASDVMSWVNQRRLRQGSFEGVVRVTFEMRRAA